MISAFVTCQSVAGLAMLLTYVTSMTLIGREMACLHVQFHCAKIIPRPSTEVARISLSLLRTVLPCERL